MAIFYKSISVTAKAGSGLWQDSEKHKFLYNASDSNSGFTANKITLQFVSGTGPVEVSFNGLNIHAELGSGGQPKLLELPDQRSSDVWVRGTGDEVLQIWAWS